MKQLSISLLALFSALCLSAQVTLTLTNIPANTPNNAPLYIAGNFQGWEVANSDYQLNNNENGTYSITFSPTIGELKFKLSRGTWDSVEGNANGDFRADRTLNYTGGQVTENLSVLSWEDLGVGGGSGNTTKASNVFLLDNDFYMPQLNKHRQIWMYLPPDYSTSNKDYPVLYMHDAQNIFDAYTSFSGEWGVDETLNELFANGDYGCIVIGIENGGSERLNEYSPWYNNNYQAGGNGDEYISFIINDLKPYVDNNYRTLPAREYTGMMGSSMGGLISQYAGIQHQDVFTKIGVFSSAFWFSEGEVYEQVEAIGEQQEGMKFYYITGEQESSTQVEDTNLMLDYMFNHGFSWEELYKEIHADGQHTEWYWNREFADAYQWLFGDLNFTSTDNLATSPLQLLPNPAHNQLYIQNSQFLQSPRVLIYDLSGKQWINQDLRDSGVNVADLPKGVYIVQIIEAKKTVFARKFVKE